MPRLLRAPAFAGIWEKSDGKGPETVAIITSSSNELAATITVACPVVLPQEFMAGWIGGEPLPIRSSTH